MITKLPKSIVERHSDYRKYVRQITDSVPRGKFWTGFSGYFDATLGHYGYRCKGRAKNYLPRIYAWHKTIVSQVPAAMWSEYQRHRRKLNSDGPGTMINKKLAVINDRRFLVNKKYLLTEYYFHRIRNEGLQPKTILEIGAGSGLLGAMFHQACGSKILIIDLPEMLILSSALLGYCFPEGRILFPHEVDDQKEKILDYDIVLLHSLQIPYLQNVKADLAINIASFMEMDFTEVERYFALIDQHLEIGGYFFCSNRDKKITVYEEYPWNEYGNYRDVFYESCRFTTSRKNPFLDRLREKIALKGAS